MRVRGGVVHGSMVRPVLMDLHDTPAKDDTTRASHALIRIKRVHVPVLSPNWGSQVYRAKLSGLIRVNTFNMNRTGLLQKVGNMNHLTTRLDRNEYQLMTSLNTTAVRHTNHFGPHSLDTIPSVETRMACRHTSIVTPARARWNMWS